MGHHLDDQADAQRFLGVDMVPHQAVAQRVLDPGQHGPEEARVGAVAHLGLGEDGLLRGDGDVGAQRQPRARAHGPAVDGADDRLVQLPQPQELVALPPAPGIDPVRRGLARGNAVGPFEVAPPPRLGPLVHARGKGAPGAGDDDGADLGVGHGLVQRRRHLVLGRGADGVHHLRAVERDQPGGAALLVQDLGVVCHGLFLSPYFSFFHTIR